ncbi:hypothetical protein IP65_19675 [Novosphingobium sp. AAP1]|uniref:hypothetical protein n=1 Tax=Novosphingobium sp. AAP1 TaxID=1523413 RepID=UPI0006B8B34C|nr:hypothetical protein [Novosphingobium sp. AAP1]KPF50530.1 hypothetical protein IP65_19675 [Novosphingobium sp. AAP1]
MKEGNATIAPERDTLADLVARCLQFGNADVFALGAQLSIKRLGEIAGYAFMMGDADGKPAASAVTLILPPAGGRTSEDMVAEVEDGLSRAWRQFDEDDERTAPFVANARKNLRIEQMENFEAVVLVARLARAEDREFLVVGEASLYRHPDAKLPTIEPCSVEDVWCAHLHRLMLGAEATAQKTGSYVALDIAEYFPSRATNMDLLQSAGDVGLVSSDFTPRMSHDEVLGHVGALYDAAARGDVGAALAAIGKEDRMSELQNWMLRLVVHDRAGLRDQVHAMLDGFREVAADFDVRTLVSVARIAAENDRDDMAQALLEQALPDLRSETDLEQAAHAAHKTGRQPLVEAVREKLRRLHRGSELLRLDDASAAARDGDYATAAALLAGATDEANRERAKMFYILAEGVASHDFETPTALARALCQQLPERASSIQYELIRSLERCGRRSDALELLLSGDIVWTENWFSIAAGLVGRALVADPQIVTEDVMRMLLGICIEHLSQHPDDALARMSIADLLDSTRVGSVGIALLAFTAINGASFSLVIEPEPKQSARLDDISRVSAILERILLWLAEQGDGVIITGRHHIPAEVLKENPDAVLDGLLRLADHFAPDASDETDATLMNHLAAAAVAVAPSAADADRDLAVIRGVALKLGLGGRPQHARDLAEQVLQLAGDRPERRRKALTTFADIYGRLGHTREALLTLAAAMALPMPQGLHEVWTEQTLLLRLARDVGLTDQALKLIGRLRLAIAEAGSPGGYDHRLNTLEILAQDQKRRYGDKDAWSAEELLRAATANASAILDTGDEVLPITFMIKQLSDEAVEKSIAVPAETLKLLDKLIDRLAPAHRTLITAIARRPDLASVAAFTGPIQASRYNEDASYDLRLARVMSRRLARAAVADGDPGAFAYAVETLATQGIGSRNSKGEVVAATRVLSDQKGALLAAVSIAAYGLPVVGMVLDEQGLMTMTVSTDGTAESLAVARDTFDPSSLPAWRERYPYWYSDPKLDEPGFRASTERIGLPSLPERALIVSGDMTNVPPNVLRVDGLLAGENRVIATTPSLGWLQSSLMNARVGNGSAAAWIPVVESEAGTDVLELLRDEISDVLDGSSIRLDTTTRSPMALSGADLAIIGAHGGLAEPNRYFRSLSDDRDEPADLRLLNDALRGSRIALLFVCSGGRLDRHPESGGLVGIPNRLLDLGLDAVVAPAWPIPFNAPRPWLRAFLSEWYRGAPAIDACASANQAVAKASSHDLRRSLAMTLHGNPFITFR